MAYKSAILTMSKSELMEEMCKFQESRALHGSLTPEMMVLGLVLFEALDNLAETDEFKNLVGAYRRHLKLEYDNYLKGN